MIAQRSSHATRHIHAVTPLLLSLLVPDDREVVVVEERSGEGLPCRLTIRQIPIACVIEEEGVDGEHAALQAGIVEAASIGFHPPRDDQRECMPIQAIGLIGHHVERDTRSHDHIVAARLQARAGIEGDPILRAGRERETGVRRPYSTNARRPPRTRKFSRGETTIPPACGSLPTFADSPAVLKPTCPPSTSTTLPPRSSARRNVAAKR